MFAARRRPQTSTDPTERPGLAEEALAFLRRHGLDSTPANYTLAYLSHADRDSFIARAIDAVLMEDGTLSQGDADRIMTSHLLNQNRDAPKPEGESEEQSLIRRQTITLADIAADTIAATGAFSQSLAHDLAHLGEGGIAATVSTMIERSARAEQRLADAVRQIDSLRQEVEAAKNDAARDALTGLYNRRGIAPRLGALAGRTAAVALIDIDHFKAINDRFGHGVGDRVLKAVAKTLSAACAPHEVARWGGEEFLVLFDGVSGEEARVIVEAARETLESRKLKVRETDDDVGALTFSAGIADVGEGDADSAMALADERMYRAKDEGRNRVAI